MDRAARPQMERKRNNLKICNKTICIIHIYKPLRDKNIHLSLRRDTKKKKNNVPIYGEGVTLDRDEQDALSLPPKYCIFGDIKIEEIQ